MNRNSLAILAGCVLVVAILVENGVERNALRHRLVKEQATTDRAITLAELWKERAEMWSNSFFSGTVRGKGTDALDHAYLTNAKDIFVFGVRVGTNKQTKTNP